MNNGSVTRPQPLPRISSAIDLTITNAENALNCEWKVAHATFGSDHTPVITNMTLGLNMTMETHKVIVKEKSFMVKKPWWNVASSRALAMCLRKSREFNILGSREYYDAKCEKSFKAIKRAAKN